MSREHRGWWLSILILALGMVPAQAATIQVVIEGLAFSPATISAKVGDTIEWINKDPLVHTATVKGSWDVMLPANKTVIQHLEKKEAVDFYCRFHPNMTGRLMVD